MGSVLILPIRSMHHDGPDQPKRIDGQVALAAGDLFACVVTAFLAALGRANRLAVDDGRRGRRFFSNGLTNLHPQRVVNAFPGSVVSPVPEDIVNGLPVGKVVRHLSPLTAGASNVQDRVDYPPPTDWPSSVSAPLR